MFWVFVAIVLIVLFIPALIFCIAPGKMSPEAKETVKAFLGLNCAHRGLYSKNQQIPENSIPAFIAAKNGNYGVELDIQLSKDGRVVVFHDNDLMRVCSLNKNVNSMDFKELSKLPLFDTGEHIPLLTDVLEVLENTPVIVELKAAGTDNIKLCEETLEIMREKGQNWCIESFDPRIVAWFRKNAPDVLRGQLSCLPHEYGKVSKTTAFILGNLLMNFISRPHFIAYSTSPHPLPVRLCRTMNPLNVVWTVKPEDDIKFFENKNDILIFEHYEPDPKFK